MDDNCDRCVLRQGCPWVVGRRVECRDSDQPVVCVEPCLISTLYLSKETVQFFGRFLHLRFGVLPISWWSFFRFSFSLGCPSFKIIGSLESLYMYNLSLSCHLPILAAESILEKNSSKGTAEFEPDHIGTRVMRDRPL